MEIKIWKNIKKNFKSKSQRSEKKWNGHSHELAEVLRIGKLGDIGSMIRPSDDYTKDIYRITTYSMIMLR